LPRHCRPSAPAARSGRHARTSCRSTRRPELARARASWLATHQRWCGCLWCWRW
jgi:hypothetical protein